MTDKNELAIVKAEDLTLVENPGLSELQLAQLLKATPAQYIRERPAKGGGKWQYVTGGYVKKVLNLMFGWRWNFEIVDETIHLEAGQVIVKGKLTCFNGDDAIVKMQYGRADIKFKKQSKDKSAFETEPRQPLDLGNDMKAAATDCLKKCASEIGIAADIYNKEEFREISVDVTNGEGHKDDLAEIVELFNDNAKLMLANDIVERIADIIKTEEKESYQKALTILRPL